MCMASAAQWVVAHNPSEAGCCIVNCDDVGIGALCGSRRNRSTKHVCRGEGMAAACQCRVMSTAAWCVVCPHQQFHCKFIAFARASSCQVVLSLSTECCRVWDKHDKRVARCHCQHRWPRAKACIGAACMRCLHAGCWPGFQHPCVHCNAQLRSVDVAHQTVCC